MREKKGQPKQLRLGTPRAQPGLLEEGAGEPAPVEATGPAWRFCARCGKPIAPDASACGWCKPPPRKEKEKVEPEESGSLF